MRILDLVHRESQEMKKILEVIDNFICRCIDISEQEVILDSLKSMGKALAKKLIVSFEPVLIKKEAL